MADGHVWLRRTLPLVAFLLVGGCGFRTDTGAPLARKQLWEVFFNQGNPVAVAGLYSQNAELVMSGAAPIRGREAIGAAIVRMAQSGVKVRIAVDRSAATGDLAYFSGPYWVLRQQRVIEHGTYLEVWHRYAGQWLIDLDLNVTGTPIIPDRGADQDRDILPSSGTR